MLAALMLVAVTRCSSSSPELVFDEDDPPGELAFVEIEPPLEDADRTLALFEASWVCELERRSFASPADRDQALVDALADGALTRAAYDGFKERLGAEQDLRDAVLFHYQQGCLS